MFVTNKELRKRLAAGQLHWCFVEWVYWQPLLILTMGTAAALVLSLVWRGSRPGTEPPTVQPEPEAREEPEQTEK